MLKIVLLSCEVSHCYVLLRRNGGYFNVNKLFTFRTHFAHIYLISWYYQMKEENKMIAYPVKKRMDAENYKKLVEITDLVLCTETLNLNANSKETVTNQLKCYNAILEVVLGR